MTTEELLALIEKLDGIIEYPDDRENTGDYKTARKALVSIVRRKVMNL